jgi:hypothetical protein
MPSPSVYPESEPEPTRSGSRFGLILNLVFTALDFAAATRLDPQGAMLIGLIVQACFSLIMAAGCGVPLLAAARQGSRR